MASRPHLHNPEDAFEDKELIIHGSCISSIAKIERK